MGFFKRSQEELALKRIAVELGLILPYKLVVIEGYGSRILNKGTERETMINGSDLGCLVFPIKGPKYTFHEMVLRKRPTWEEDLYVLAHEAKHAKQCEDQGDPSVFYRLWCQENATVGYRRNRYEQDARQYGVRYVERNLETGPLELVDAQDTRLRRRRMPSEVLDDFRENFEVTVGDFMSTYERI